MMGIGEQTLLFLMCCFIVVIAGAVSLFTFIIFYVEMAKKKKLENNVHFYVARDNNCDLYLYLGKPRRSTVFFISFVHPSDFICRSDRFDSFGLNEKNYANLKWEDKPIEMFLNINN